MPEPRCWRAADGMHWSCPDCLWDFPVVGSAVEAHLACAEHWRLSHRLSAWQCDDCGAETDDDPGDHAGDLCDQCYGGLLREVPDA